MILKLISEVSEHAFVNSGTAEEDLFREPVFFKLQPIRGQGRRGVTLF